jgi:hypothetical protein
MNKELDDAQRKEVERLAKEVVFGGYQANETVYNSEQSVIRVYRIPERIRKISEQGL